MAPTIVKKPVLVIIIAEFLFRYYCSFQSTLETFEKIRAQSLTSLKADLRQNINRYFIFSRSQFKKFSLFEFPATAFFKLQGDPRLILASPSKLYPYDQQGGAI